MLEGLEIDLDGIAEPRARELIRRLMNLLEDAMSGLRAAQAEVQRLRDEVNRLKGEQGKPKIPGSKPSGGRPDISSERERRKAKARTRTAKMQDIAIDREEVLKVAPETLPADAQFKGYEDVVVQDVIFRSDNILFRKEKYYSPSERKTYLAELPTGYAGQYGPGVKALALVFYFGAQMSEPKVAETLRSVGIRISDGQVSNLLIKDKEPFHAEKAALYEAALASSPWQHMDDTGTRVNGKNEHCHVVCSPLHTTYFTKPGKDRLTVIDVLRGDRPRQFVINAEALALAEQLGLSARRRREMGQLPHDQTVDEATLAHWLDTQMSGLGPNQHGWVLDAAAIAAYHAETGFPVVRLVIVDGAPQFKGVTEVLGLCWVHEGRHYKKLIAWLPMHAHYVEAFLKRFWEYYDGLRKYRAQPTAQEAKRLREEFDKLFATRTGYRALDERIAKTEAKKAVLLAVLAHPEIELHNNPAELGVRARVRKRDVSFGPRTTDGVKAWDTFMTLAATAKKLRGAHSRVGGGQEEGIEAIVGPGEAKHEQIVESILAPAHADALESLLDEPLDGALDEAAADGSAVGLVRRVVEV